MTNHRDSENKEHRSAVENFTHVHRTTTSNWLITLSVLYMPIALYLGFVARPLVWLLSTWTSADAQQLAVAQFVDIVVWTVLPLIGGTFVYYKVTEPRN